VKLAGRRNELHLLVNVDCEMSDSELSGILLKNKTVKYLYCASYSVCVQKKYNTVRQGSANLGCHVTWATKFVMVMPHIFSTAIPKFSLFTHESLKMSFLATRFWMWLQDFWKICGPLLYRDLMTLNPRLKE
jgi:hypothetical protein